MYSEVILFWFVRPPMSPSPVQYLESLHSSQFLNHYSLPWLAESFQCIHNLVSSKRFKETVMQSYQELLLYIQPLSLWYARHKFQPPKQTWTPIIPSDQWDHCALIELTLPAPHPERSFLEGSRRWLCNWHRVFSFSQWSHLFSDCCLECEHFYFSFIFFFIAELIEYKFSHNDWKWKSLVQWSGSHWIVHSSPSYMTLILSDCLFV